MLPKGRRQEQLPEPGLTYPTKAKDVYKAVLRIRIRSDPVFFGYPDPDPGKYRIRIRILYPQKDPMLFKFSCYKIV